MSYNQDGNFNAAAQDGAKQVSLPFQNEGNYYAKIYTRRYKSVATAYMPIRSASTAFINYSLNSEVLGSWGSDESTVSSNLIPNPVDGAITVDKMLETVTNAQHQRYLTSTVPSGACTGSVFLRYAERTWARVLLYNGTDAEFAQVDIDLSTGALSNVVGTATASVVIGSDSFYYLTLKGTATVANSSFYVRVGSAAGTFSYAGDITKGIYIWGGQVSTGAAPIPYIVTTSTTRSVTVPAVDADDPVAFLVDETAPDPSGLEVGMAEWSRSYANVPAPIITYSNLVLNKPNPAALSGSTTTFGDMYSTSAFTAYLGRITIYRSKYYVNNQVWKLSLPAATSANSGANTRIIFVAGHGLAGTETLLSQASVGGAFVPFVAGSYNIVSGSSIDLLNVNFGVYAGVVAVYLRAYTIGQDRVRTKKTKSFYLPGYSVGITTAADIPLPNPLLSDTAFIDALVAQTSGYLTYDASELGYWMAPIYQQEIIEIDMGDL